MVKKGSQFTTYHSDFKLQVVEDYLSGKSGSLTLIARKYGLTRFTRAIIYPSSKVCQTRRYDTRGTK